MINGYYVIKSGDEFVASSKNLITTSGYETINKYLAGAYKTWGEYLAIGIFVTKTSASASDTQLEYEVERYPVNLRSYATVSGSNQILFKANLPNTLVASITDIGLFNGTNNSKDNFMISDFSELTGSVTSWTSTASLAANSKYGASNVYTRTAGTVIANTDINLDLSSYTATDYASLLIYCPATASGKFQLSFLDTDGYYWNTASGTASAAGGSWMLVTIPFTNQPATGFNYSVNSMSINFVTTSTASLLFDCLKLNSGVTKYTDSNVISRTIFSKPIAKDYGKPMQIEYYVQVT